MPGTVARKLIESHLESGEMMPGEEIAIRIDQTLTQLAITGRPLHIRMPEVRGVRLEGELPEWCSAVPAFTKPAAWDASAWVRRPLPIATRCAPCHATSPGALARRKTRSG